MKLVKIMLQNVTYNSYRKHTTPNKLMAIDFVSHALHFRLPTVTSPLKVLCKIRETKCLCCACKSTHISTELIKVSRVGILTQRSTTMLKTD